jgi:cellulose synthase operon protein C
VMLRRAEARLAQADVDGARKWLSGLASDATDGRAALARGRAWAMAASAEAFPSLLRAYMLDTPGASEALSSTLAWVEADEATRARVRAVVDAKGEAPLARFRAAFARADGRRDEARAALLDAVRAGDATAARPLLDAALQDRDLAALKDAVDALAAGGAEGDPIATDARRLLEADSPERTLDALAAVTTDRVVPWASERALAVARAWAPADSPAAWPALLARLDAHARTLHDLGALGDVAQLAIERTRPVRVAIVGEFNAGKSTFINALIGQDVAPTGVLPTTATLHHLRYAPDPIARVLFAPPHEPPERIVRVEDLRATLKSVENDPVRRVEILLPIASLTRVEILDTPGFNAPDKRHAEVAREAFEEADAAIWLLDAAQPLKQTERAVLEEAKAARLPVQMLVNKADRLGPDDLAKVMGLLDLALAEAGLTSMVPPIALSARLALAGRLGDAAALAASQWPRVQALLDEELVARSADVKERALRRRAARIVAKLGASAARAMEAEQAEREGEEARVRALREAAVKVDRDAEALTKRVAGALEPGMTAWRRDLRVVAAGRDDAAAAEDPSLGKYRTDRALAHLAGPLEAELAKLTPDPSARRLQLLPLRAIARAAVRTFAASVNGLDAPPSPLAGAALATLGDVLSRAAVPQATSAAATGLVRELRALSEALA